MAPKPYFSTQLLAEMYQVMLDENALTINDALAAQIMAIANSEIQISNDPSIHPTIIPANNLNRGGCFI